MARSATNYSSVPQPPDLTRFDEDRPIAVPQDQRRNRRESIESFVVVLVGFLVWSFEAEGFMIPTGSMAPTLMGRHKEIECAECGWTYRVNADCEIDSNGAGGATGLRVTWGVCENCRAPARLDQEPSFAGDRIYTLKTDTGASLLPGLTRSEPRRWDVTVFKLPEDPSVRYVKRLIGMPGEVLRIEHGDLWRSLDDGETFEILRRPPAQSLQVNIPVYDDEQRPRRLQSDPRWRRWTMSDAWNEPVPGTYRLASPTETWQELRYRHRVPTPEQWEAVAQGRALPEPPRSTLITDFCSYNTDLVPQNHSQVRLATRPWFQPHWVGDLSISMRLEVEEPVGRVRLQLIEEGVAHDCEIDLATGAARLLREGVALGEPVPTSVKTRGTFELTFSNIDDRLTLWVDGERPFADGRTYDPGERDGRPSPTDADLEPARIYVQGGSVAVGGLSLKRDVYYTQAPSEPDSDDLLDYRVRPPDHLFRLLATPSEYAKLRWREPRDYWIAEGTYLMLGDNSPWSRDGRAWTRVDQTSSFDPDRGWDASGRESWEVPRSLIIGRAFSVYWPHFQPLWPKLRLGVDLVLPARPNVESIRWIY